jgi:ornithine carbamoyltransferase
MAAAAKALPAVSDIATGTEWTPAQVRELFRLAADIKASPERYRDALASKFIALIFEKPSLRTRVTFEIGIQSLGGGAVFLDHQHSRLGARESIHDVAKNLERWVQGIVARVFAHRSIEELAAHAGVPVINALCDRYHPCQAFADFFTLEEHFGSTKGLRFTYVGDGNNMCHSLLLTGALCGAHVRVATPNGFEPLPEIVMEAERIAQETQGKIEVMGAPEVAVAGAQAVYTDVWASMGQEEEAAVRERAFAGYQVNEALMRHAAKNAVFMHCLPAHRGLEVTDAVLDAPNSMVFDEAENRLHVQKAILLGLLS